MEPKAENVVQNIGAMAETISVFYNSIARQVPKDAALELTKHFMDLTITRRPAAISPETKAAAKAMAEIQKQIVEQIEKRRQAGQNSAPPEKPAEAAPREGAGTPARPGQMQTAAGGASASQKPGTPRPPEGVREFSTSEQARPETAQEAGTPEQTRPETPEA